MNEQLLASLKPGILEGNIYAKLTNIAGVTLFEFLFNPEEKQYNIKSNYTETPTALTNLPNQIYNYTSGLTLSLPNILLLSHSRGKTVTQLIEQLKSLMMIDIANKRYEPTKLKFIWGSDVFSPVVLTELSWNETEWLSGEVAGCRLNITLVQTPNRGIITPTNTVTSITNREKEVANSKATSWLNSNIKKLKKPIAALVQTKKYRLSTSNAGVVTIYDSYGKLLGTVGVYNSTKLDTSKNDVI